LDLFSDLFLVIQEQEELVVSRVQRNRLACKHEETLFADFRLVVAGSKVGDEETSRCVCFRPIGMPGGIFEPHLRGHNRHSVFVQNDAGAIRRSGLPSSEDAENNQHPSEQPNKLHATPSLETQHRLNYILLCSGGNGPSQTDSLSNCVLLAGSPLSCNYRVQQREQLRWTGNSESF